MSLSASPAVRNATIPPQPFDALTVVDRALNFARAAHDGVGQVRKYTGLPYWQHPVEVALIVQSVEHNDDMLAAALLHDVVEDTPYTVADIESEFGSSIANLVDWLTDVSQPSDGNRAIRKAMDRQHTAKAPADAKTIKLADLLSNLQSIVDHDPNFARVYLVEMAELLPVLKSGNRQLWTRANNELTAAASRLGISIRNLGHHDRLPPSSIS